MSVTERWQALEATPSVLTGVARALGLPPSWQFHEVMSLDPELLCLIPEPCFAIVLIFPCVRMKEAGLASREGAAAATITPEAIASGWYMTQPPALPNACGTIAILHSMLNNVAELNLPADSPLAAIIAATKTASPLERAAFVDSCGFVEAAHNEHVVQGETAVLASDDVAHHFVAFTSLEGHVVEWDGAYKAGPHSHGPIREGQTFVEAAAKAIQSAYFDKMPGAIDFAILSLGPSA